MRMFIAVAALLLPLHSIAASSQGVIPEVRKEMCRNALGAHFGVAWWTLNGMSREDLHHNIDTRDDIPAAERARVHALVDELNDSGLHPQAWLDGHVRHCVNGQ